MKLRRFTAATTQKAILNVHEELGPDALIYSTRRIPHGIEVIAGSPSLEMSTNPVGDHVDIHNPTLDTSVIDKLSVQIQIMEESIKCLATHIINLNEMLEESKSKKSRSLWRVLKSKFRFKKYTIEGVYGRQSA